MANINIYGELYNDTPNGYVAPATQIKDVDLGKTQDQINAELTASGSASEANTGYVTCRTAAATAAKEINDTTTLAGFVLDSNIRLLVKMTYANTAENPTLNINGTGAKVINYNGAVASAENSWNANEILDVFYDGTSYVARPYRNVDAEPTAGSENLVKSGGIQNELALGAVYDVSAKNPTAGPNNDGKWESLSVLLSDANLSTLIPVAVRKGGMSIKFVQSSDNKYMQFRCTADEFTTDVTKWAICDEDVLVDSSKYIYVKTDAEGKILYGIKSDGGFFFGVGCPQQVKDYIQEKIDELNLDNLLNDKVDKATGKSLIDESYADSQSAVENPEYIQVTTDNEQKILEGINIDGEKVLNIPIKTPFVDVNTDKNPEWIKVDTDKDGKILQGIKKGGTAFFNELESPTINAIRNDIEKLQYFHPIHEHNAIVSFVDDDSGQYVPEIWDEIVQRTGIRFGIACIAGFMAGQGPSTGPYVQMSLQDLQRFYDAGHEVYSHSWSHPSFRKANLETIDEQCRRSRDWMNANGFIRNSDCIVYPGGMNSRDKAEKTAVVRRHYRFGVATTEETVGVNPEPLEPLFITRCNADSNTLDYLKGKVDDAVAEHKLLVVLTHAYELMGLGTTSLSTDKSVNIQRIVDLIDYTESQGATILPLEEAIHQIYGWNQY